MVKNTGGAGREASRMSQTGQAEPPNLGSVVQTVQVEPPLTPPQTNILGPAMGEAQQQYRTGLIDRHLDNEAFREEIRQQEREAAEEQARTARQEQRRQNS